MAIASNQLPPSFTPLNFPQAEDGYLPRSRCSPAGYLCVPHCDKIHGLGSQLTSDRGSDENLACRGWTLLVCLHRRALDSHNTSNNNNPVLISSWEFVTTLDYEWSVIRGHRPYRWPIWVSSDALFVSIALLGAGLIYSLWQIYSTTRISSVIGLIIVLYGLNVSTPYNCEVCKFHICLIFP